MKCSEPYKIVIKGSEFFFHDITSRTPGYVSREMNGDNYKLSKISFQSGDVVVDVGANIGMFSIFLAKKYPFLKIYAFEPVKETFENMLRNLEINNITVGVVTAVNKAVAKDDKGVSILVSNRESQTNTMIENSGFKNSSQEMVESITVPQIFEEYGIIKCKLFKIDCEGCEYESLYNTPDQYFGRIEHFRGEFHEIDALVKKGFTAHNLLNYVQSRVSDVSVRLEKFLHGELNKWNRKQHLKKHKSEI